MGGTGTILELAREHVLVVPLTMNDMVLCFLTVQCDVSECSFGSLVATTCLAWRLALEAWRTVQ